MSRNRDTTDRASDVVVSPFGPAELKEANALIERAIEEDLPGDVDVTTDPLFRRGEVPPAGVRALFVSRASATLAGVPVVDALFARYGDDARVEVFAADGTALEAGTEFMAVSGPAATIFRLERIALNFLQHLSGIATTTARWTRELHGTGAALLDTRKTLPGWRRLEKYAVRCGGGRNHRLSLADEVLLKDNHVRTLRELGRGDLADWVERLRSASPGLFIEVEVDTRVDFLGALGLPVDALLLDNFSLADLRWAVNERDTRRGEHGSEGPLLEASGGVTLDRARAVAETGVDRLSVGALTHSAESVDIALDVADVFEITLLKEIDDS